MPLCRERCYLLTGGQTPCEVICSCNWIESLRVGQTVSRGDEIGYFLFGGSDIVMLFQKGYDVEIVHDGGHLLMGEAYARLTKTN